MLSSRSHSPPRPKRPSFFRSLSSSSSINSLTHSISPRKDKPRLYLALYPRGGSNSFSSYSSSLTCDSYHWALLVGPQSASRKEAGTCYQIVHASPSTPSSSHDFSSFYEETDLSQQSEAQSQALLARITLAKVLDENRLRELLLSLPSVSPCSSNHSSSSHHSDSDDDTSNLYAGSSCLTWVKAAFKLLTADPKCLRGYLKPDEWLEVEEVARLYMKKKRRQGRFAGQGSYDAGRPWDDQEIPTWNLWENRETTP